ncbi:unnamed protein product [Moneuplotes crassus]|uniref:Uncharacterized protein n=1 Tax=Euplotes crassus TaxID=5936 RepID=A0AAD1XEJ4_EUPCR|nr:unnamed protein product [Moneuplotes crassus]
MPISSNKDINELCQGYFRANQNGQQRCILVSEGDNNDNSFHAAKPDFGDLSPIRFQNGMSPFLSESQYLETMEDDRILTQKAKVFNELILTEERDLSGTPLASTNTKHDRYANEENSRDILVKHASKSIEGKNIEEYLDNIHARPEFRSRRTKHGKHYSPCTKQRAITLAQENGIQEASTALSIPVNSIRRWMEGNQLCVLQVGSIRK